MSGSTNGCTEVRELVPWYPTGALDEDERSRVEAHVSECEVCRGLLDFSAEIGQSMRQVRASHPAPEALVVFVEGSPAMTATERDAIEAHIMVCPSCRKQAELLDRVDRDDSTVVAVRERRKERSPLARYWDSLKRGILSPVPAAIYLVAAIAAVASLFALPGDHTPPKTGVGTASGVVIVPDEGDIVRQASRGEADRTVVDASATRLLLLELTYLQSPPRDQDAYAVSFVPSGGTKPVLSTTVMGATFRDNYTIGFILRPRALDPGDYHVTVTDPAGEEVFHSTVTIRL